MRDDLWRLVYILSLALVFLGWLATHTFRQTAAAFPDKITLSKYSDFLDVLWYITIYGAIRKTFYLVLEEKLHSILKRNDPLNFELKKGKIVKEGFCSIYYLFASVVGIKLFYGTNMLPWLCLGQHECIDLFGLWPLEPLTPDVRTYFMFQLAYHLYTVIEYQWQNRVNRVAEYNEMMLHHFLAVSLITVCYLASLYSLGITILLIADITDFFLSVAKFVRDTRIGHQYRAADLAFLLIVVSWSYLRGVVMSGCIISGCVMAGYRVAIGDLSWTNTVSRAFVVDHPVYCWLPFLLVSILCVLNFYWIFIIFHIAFRRLFKKDTNFTNTEHGEKLYKNAKLNPKSDLPSDASTKGK